MESSIEEWVNSATADRVVFRQAVHIVLSAIAGSEYLKPKMIMKGGMLLGIRYKSSRFTEDIDFSTKMKLSDIDEGEFREELNDALIIASDELAYGVSCRVQSLAIQPKKKHQNATFPSFNLTIGYARKKSAGEMDRLNRGQCPKTIKIDYSFNELSYSIDDIIINNEDGVSAYGVTDLIAEKLRSIIQQPYRNRSRRQDIYDLDFLLDSVNLDEQESWSVLYSLMEKSKERIPDGDVNPSTLDRDDIRNFSQEKYDQLFAEVEGDVKGFEITYNRVNDFYKSLPWDVLR